MVDLVAKKLIPAELGVLLEYREMWGAEGSSAADAEDRQLRDGQSDTSQPVDATRSGWNLEWQVSRTFPVAVDC